MQVEKGGGVVLRQVTRRISSFRPALSLQLVLSDDVNRLGLDKSWHACVFCSVFYCINPSSIFIPPSLLSSYKYSCFLTPTNLTPPINITTKSQTSLQNVNRRPLNNSSNPKDCTNEYKHFNPKRILLRNRIYKYPNRFRSRIKPATTNHCWLCSRCTYSVKNIKRWCWCGVFGIVIQRPPHPSETPTLDRLREIQWPPHPSPREETIWSAVVWIESCFFWNSSSTPSLPFPFSFSQQAVGTTPRSSHILRESNNHGFKNEI